MSFHGPPFLPVLLAFAALAPGSAVVAQQESPSCAPDNAGLTLSDGFCALIVADDVGPARHLTVAENGDVFVAITVRGRDGNDGGILALRDRDGDGRADERNRFAGGVGHDVEFHNGYLYFSTQEAVLRFPWRRGALEPAGPAETIVSGLPATRSHRAKSIAFGPDGALYVNIGSPSNACQESDRVAGSPGRDPCAERETRAGIWRFDADEPNQQQGDGRRYATGLRNTVALTAHPVTGALYGAVHGRDQLSANWGALYTDAQSAEKPAEELVRIEDGDDVGWPYCYYDPELRKKVLAPEYGGDGKTVGRCASMKPPLIAFPAHWAPDGLVFYTGSQFPSRYRGGAFIAFHGSWNRAPLPQDGYHVVFVPFASGEPTGTWEVFADGFAGGAKDPRAAIHRPVGVAQGPDGSLYVSDDQGGRIYRVVYRGDR